jgi:hypothetical protein
MEELLREFQQKFEFLAAISAIAAKRHAKPSSIASSFRNTGIFPYNPDVVLVAGMNAAEGRVLK